MLSRNSCCSSKERASLVCCKEHVMLSLPLPPHLIHKLDAIMIPASYLVQSVKMFLRLKIRRSSHLSHVKCWSDEVIFFTEVKFFSCLSCATPDLYLLSHGPLPNHLTNFSLLHIPLCCSNTADFPATGFFLSYPNHGNLKCVLLFYQPRGVCWWSHVDPWAHCWA